MWGAGCIMAELWTRYPIMQGNTEQQQIMRISQLCGSFTPDVSDDRFRDAKKLFRFNNNIFISIFIFYFNMTT